MHSRQQSSSESKMSRVHYLLYLLTVYFSWNQSVRAQENTVTIEVSPEKEFYTVGENLSLSCVINPLPPPPIFYEWECDGCFADGMITKVISRNLTDMDGNSIIRCSVEFQPENSTFQSNRFNLQVTQVPTPFVTLQPSNITQEIVGNSFTIECRVETVPGVNFVLITWTAPGGQEIINNNRVIIHPTNSNGNNYTSILQFTYLMEGDEGNYTCNWMILETSGSQSVVLQLIIPSPNVSVTALNNQTVGQSLALQCEVTSVRGITSRVDIVWSSGSTVLQRMNVLSTMMSNSLVYTNSYTISQLNITDDGRVIQCEVVINASPPVVANGDITLDVTVPTPNVTISPPGPMLGAMVGSPQDINCTVSTVSGVESSLVIISWMGPGVTITNESRVTISPTTFDGSNYISSLSFEYLAEEDEGTYMCNVTILDTRGSESIEMSLTIPDPSVIVIFFNNQTDNLVDHITQTVGQPLTLRCVATTVRGITSRVDIVWREGDRVLNRTNRTIGTTATARRNALEYIDTYDISQLNTTDDGRVIQCEVVINASPSVMASGNITLDVTVPNFIVRIELRSDKLTVGDEAIIDCTVSTVSGVELSSVMIIWIGPRGVITNDRRVTISTTTFSGNNYTSSVIFEYLEEINIGTYTCNVTILDTSESQSVELSSLNVMVLSLKENAQLISILEGQSVTLSCVPNPDDLMVNWTRRGVVIDSSDVVSLSPENLQHILTIKNATISDSGDYVCYLVDFPLLINRTIRLNVLQACQKDYIGGILWNRHMINQVARIRCSAFHSSFRPGVYVTRMCNSNGEWSNVDYSSCTMRLEAVPLILVEVKDPGSSANVTSVVNQVTGSVLRTNYTVLRTTHQFYEIFPSNILVIFVEINSISVSENIIASLIDLLRGLSVETSITGFQPSFQCSCADVVMKSTLNYICYGPSVPPCTFINGSYQCTEDTYTGNGILCGVDSDSDGFPDGQLDCTDQQCEQDECPYTFSESTNSPTLCSPVSDIGCQPENDTVWGIGWHFATAGSVAEGKCPGLSESSGLAYRICFQNALWDTFVNVTQCQSIELMVLNSILDENQDILSSNINTEIRNMTVLFDIREVEAISVDVSDLTNVSTAIVPNDINTTNNIVNSLIRITETVVETDTSAAESAESLQSIVESTSSTINNLLSSSNANSFKESNNMQLPVAEDLLRNTENLAIVIGDVLELTSGNISDTNTTIIRDNIVFNAQLVPENTELIDDIIFPEVGDTQVIIPANAIVHQRATERISVPVVNYIAQNLQSYLNNQTISEGFSATSSGMIISSQISKAFIQLPENGTVQLKFSNTDIIGEVFTTLCVFWDFLLKNENNQTMGGWSSEGIIQDNDTTPPILCNTTHLTSFSVLVSSKGESFQTAAELHVASYVGCGISIFCLLLTVTAIVTLRKVAFKAHHNKVHLNLSIALLLGLVVFISGIETAKDNKVGCIIVTTLLHYFFLAVFCWALCEGIIIYILFVKVFYQGIFQQMYFYLLLGWGLPIPIVGISVGLSYNKYGIKDNNGQTVACWISDENGANWAFTAPMIVIILINVVILIASLCKIYQARKNYLALTNAQKSKYNIAKTLIWSILALLPLLCGTWILGLLFLVDSESEVFVWIFTIINTLQGFAIFFFHVVKNKEVTNEIKERFKKWRNRQLLLKDSTLERKQMNENFALKGKDAAIESSKKVDTLPNFVPSASKPVSFISVDDVVTVNDDELAVLTSKDDLQNDEPY